MNLADIGIEDVDEYVDERDELSPRTLVS